MKIICDQKNQFYLGSFGDAIIKLKLSDIIPINKNNIQKEIDLMSLIITDENSNNIIEILNAANIASSAIHPMVKPINTYKLVEVTGEWEEYLKSISSILIKHKKTKKKNKLLKKITIKKYLIL